MKKILSALITTTAALAAVPAHADCISDLFVDHSVGRTRQSSYVGQRADRRFARYATAGLSASGTGTARVWRGTYRELFSDRTVSCGNFCSQPFAQSRADSVELTIGVNGSVLVRNLTWGGTSNRTLTCVNGQPAIFWLGETWILAFSPSQGPVE